MGFAYNYTTFDLQKLNKYNLVKLSKKSRDICCKYFKKP